MSDPEERETPEQEVSLRDVMKAVKTQEDLTQAIWAIDNSKTDYARETITEVIDKIKRRNKLVKIADSSEGGWETVRQYESNPVASNSDDESKLNKADSRAIRKRNAKGKKSASKKAHYSAPSTIC
ncbi:Hypothetical predicted protein [Mytilus galloprovincialis]|uniref:Uncharacterized protein n=1 Tax=Mytilus galloprovincialis TaxID=29158 RepID=A0A8B6BJC8_MYTGA|nr:Hypothetical predicted protein [Mytilus galloprovincialis]